MESQSIASQALALDNAQIEAVMDVVLSGDVVLPDNLNEPLTKLMDVLNVATSKLCSSGSKAYNAIMSRETDEKTSEVMKLLLGAAFVPVVPVVDKILGSNFIKEKKILCHVIDIVLQQLPSQSTQDEDSKDYINVLNALLIKRGIRGKQVYDQDLLNYAIASVASRSYFGINFVFKYLIDIGADILPDRMVEGTSAFTNAVNLGNNELVQYCVNALLEKKRKISLKVVEDLLKYVSPLHHHAVMYRTAISLQLSSVDSVTEIMKLLGKSAVPATCIETAITHARYDVVLRMLETYTDPSSVDVNRSKSIFTLLCCKPSNSEMHSNVMRELINAGFTVDVETLDKVITLFEVDNSEFAAQEIVMMYQALPQNEQQSMSFDRKQLVNRLVRKRDAPMSQPTHTPTPTQDLLPAPSSAKSTAKSPGKSRSKKPKL